MLEPPFVTASTHWVSGTEQFVAAEGFALTIDPLASAHIVYVAPALKAVVSTIVEQRIAPGTLCLSRLTKNCRHRLIVEAHPRVRWYDLHASLALVQNQNLPCVPALAAFLSLPDGALAIVEAYYNANGIKDGTDAGRPKKRGRPKKVSSPLDDPNRWRKSPGWYLGLRTPGPTDEWGSGCEFVSRLA